jgi:predicted amino acid-binding ACT domain protein
MNPKGQAQGIPRQGAQADPPAPPVPWPFPEPEPLAVTARLLVCEGQSAGGGALAVTISGRDRTGLLAAVCDLVHRSDDAVQIEAGSAQAVEDFFVLFLVLRHPTDRRWLPGMVARFREMASGQVEGWQIPVAARARLEVTAPDRPGVLLGICKVLNDERARVNIRRFESETLARFPAGPDPFAGPIEPMCVLRFEIELSRAAVDSAEDLRSRLTQSGPGREIRLVL